jgi:hypothetical protein
MDKKVVLMIMIIARIAKVFDEWTWKLVASVPHRTSAMRSLHSRLSEQAFFISFFGRRKTGTLSRISVGRLKKPESDGVVDMVVARLVD